jgi:hypothetical protein
LVVFTRHAASVLAADHVVIIGSRKLMQGSPADLIQKNPKFKRAMRQIGMGVERKSKKESPGTTKRAETGIGSQKTDTQA